MWHAGRRVRDTMSARGSTCGAAIATLVVGIVACAWTCEAGLVGLQPAISNGAEVAPVERSLAELQAFVDAHGLGVRGIVPMLATGMANDIWALGDDLVMRVGRRWEEAWTDARTESVAVPVACAIGIRTPALVLHDFSQAILDAPVTVYERVHGDTLGLVIDARADWTSAMRSLGRELAKLHLEVAHVDDPNGWLDDPGHEDPRAWLAECCAHGHLDADEGALVERWLDRLEPALASAVTPRFLHDDVHANNVMVDAAGEYLALLDWGDAGWGDPAIELATFVIDWVEPMLAGYSEAGPELVDDAFAARVLWNQLGHSLRKIVLPRRTPAIGLARLRRLLALARREPTFWRPWLPAG